MERIILMVFLTALIAGCGGEEQTSVQDPPEEEEINFKCSNAAMQTFYFLGENRVKIEAVGMERESWLVDGKFYMKMTVGGTTYLVEEEAFEEMKMTVEAMQVALDTAEKYEGFDCEKGVVTEEIVTPPNLQKITSEELGEMMLAEMTKGME